MSLAGAEASDTLSGDAGATRLVGNAGVDTLDGGDGDDHLSGGDGADYLIGGLGADVQTGGIGADHFIFTSVTEAPKGSSRDVILDFSQAELDVIDLSMIDANTKKPGDQAFHVIKGHHFHSEGDHHVYGELRVDHQKAAATSMATGRPISKSAYPARIS